MGINKRPFDGKCFKCDQEAKKHRGSGYWYCAKHYRFIDMKSDARKYYGWSPSYQALEDMASSLVDMKCPVCSRVMNWFQKDGAQTVITLQHDRDGAIRFICRSCNSRHAAMDGDSFYDIGPNRKRCSQCRQVKSFSEFCKGPWWGGVSGPCKTCRRKYKSTPGYKESRRKYKSTPEYKERRRAWKRAARLRRREMKNSQ